MFEKITARTIQVKQDGFASFHQAYLDEALEFVNRISSEKNLEEIKESLQYLRKYMKGLSSEYIEELRAFELVEFKNEDETAMNVKIIMSVIAYELKQALNDISADKSGKYDLIMKKEGGSVSLKLSKVSLLSSDVEMMSFNLPEYFLSYTNRELAWSLFAVIYKAISIITKNPFLG